MRPESNLSSYRGRPVTSVELLVSSIKSLPEGVQLDMPLLVLPFSRSVFGEEGQNVEISHVPKLVCSKQKGR